ncbi:MAG: hypothetical protein WCF90_09340 [Methanomicrobiales archaeon]
MEKFLTARLGKKLLVSILNTQIDHRALSAKTDLSIAARFLGTALARRSLVIIQSDLI